MEFDKCWTAINLAISIRPTRLLFYNVDFQSDLSIDLVVTHLSAPATKRHNPVRVNVLHDIANHQPTENDRFCFKRTNLL